LKKLILLPFIALLLWNCTATAPVQTVPLSPRDAFLADSLNIPKDKLAELIAKPLYTFAPEEVDLYLRWLFHAEPDLRKRVQHLGRKNLGQPYEIYLLGEFPFEYHDPQPLISIGKSDCVVFSEHTYAMALAHDWKSFVTWLQRIRYKDGEIGLQTRNHYTEYDWDRNNSWLVTDITTQLAGENASYDTSAYDKNRFFKRWRLTTNHMPDTLIWDYIPYEHVPQILDSLQTGDFVNIVRGYPNGVWVGHVGLISRAPDGTVNFLHSTPPHVIEQDILTYPFPNPKEFNAEREAWNQSIIEKNQTIAAHNEKLKKGGLRKLWSRPKRVLAPKPIFYGFRFLRLNEDPVQNLREMHGEEALQLRIPIPLHPSQMQVKKESLPIFNPDSLQSDTLQKEIE
jgi:hypothetical protein